jgi:hypothetical protein
LRFDPALIARNGGLLQPASHRPWVTLRRRRERRGSDAATGHGLVQRQRHGIVRSRRVKLEEDGDAAFRVFRLHVQSSVAPHQEVITRNGPGVRQT